MIGVCSMCGKVRELNLEHIIPQSVGGTLEVKIYCTKCNSDLGRELDSEIAKYLGRYSTLLNVKRARGKNQPFDVDDDNSGLRLKFDGEKFVRKNPVVNKKFSEEGKLEEVEIIARSEEEREKIFKGLAKKHNINLSLLECEEINHPPPSAVHEFVLGGDVLYRAIAKISYGFAAWKLPKGIVHSTSFSNIRKFIKGESKERLVSANYEHTGFMVDNHRPLHKVHISLNRTSGLITGYVALFGTFRYTVLLSDSYKGDIEWPGIDYTFNPVSQREVPANLIFKAPTLTKNQITRPKDNPEKVKYCLEQGLKVVAQHTNGKLLGVKVEH